MTTNVFYNENAPYAAQWLRNLMAGGHLPKGTVNERSIIEVKAEETGETSHFFAGIGGWPYALRLAGWPDDCPVWTASCPCQPFSSAGKAGGVGDERHLWPAFRGLIAERHPAIVFGEQVAGSDGRKWLAGVRVDLERMGYAVGCADLPAAIVASPHQRQRLFWVAESESQRDRKESLKGGHRSREKEGRIVVAGRHRNGHASTDRVRVSDRREDGGLSTRAGVDELESVQLHGMGNAESDGRNQGTSARLRRKSDADGTGEGTAARMGIANSERRESGKPTTQTTRHRSATESTGSDGRMGVSNGESIRADHEAMFVMAYMEADPCVPWPRQS